MHSEDPYKIVYITMVPSLTHPILQPKSHETRKGSNQKSHSHYISLILIVQTTTPSNTTVSLDTLNSLK